VAGCPFYFTDVFALGPYSGNQLATLIPTEPLPDSVMQTIAREINFSETSFVTGGSIGHGFDTRIFTPYEEVPFAGHPVLGSAFVIRKAFGLQSSSQLGLNLQVGKVPVSFKEPGFQFFSRNEVQITQVEDLAGLTEELGLKSEDIDSRYPCCWASAGLGFLIIPLVSVAALQRLHSSQVNCQQPVFFFAPADAGMEEQVRARMFAPGLGVEEDAATGSACCALGGYLVEYEYFGSTQVTILIGQGFEMGRPSHIHVAASKNGKHFNIEVGGQVRLVAQGHWDMG
jgi:trans-2,3-dihydro-3-hydroxyanthranilate isomerase